MRILLSEVSRVRPTRKAMLTLAAGSGEYLVSRYIIHRTGTTKIHAGALRIAKPRNPGPEHLNLRCTGQGGGSKKNFIAWTSWAIHCGRWWSTGGVASHRPAWSKSAACRRGWTRKLDGGHREPNWGVRCGLGRGSTRQAGEWRRPS